MGDRKRVNMGNLADTVYMLGGPVPPWGDYGDILIAGMTSHLGRQDGLLQLERTGPLVPPIALAGIGEVVVTNSFRSALEASGLSGLRFQPVIKKHIVRLHWETWDRATPNPPEYPPTGEPEDYIFLGAHDPQLAAEMGDLWELCLEPHARTERQPRRSAIGEQIFVVRASWDGRDWFRAEGVSYVYVSARARNWLEAIVPEWVSFMPASIQ